MAEQTGGQKGTTGGGAGGQSGGGGGGQSGGGGAGGGGAGWPSKNPGQKSGGGRDNATPKKRSR